MSDNLKIGQIITTPQERDAIHVAIAPVVAAEQLYPGQHVRLHNGKAYRGEGGQPIGIVDPFLSVRRPYVVKGESFWLFLYPGSITSLRHDWTHPAFAVAPQATAAPQAAAERCDEEYIASKKWLTSYAVEVDLPLADLIEAANNFLDSREYHYLGFDTPDYCWKQRENFWTHFSIYTGRETDGRDENFFRCAY